MTPSFALRTFARQLSAEYAATCRRRARRFMRGDVSVYRPGVTCERIKERLLVLASWAADANAEALALELGEMCAEGSS